MFLKFQGQTQTEFEKEVSVRRAQRTCKESHFSALKYSERKKRKGMRTQAAH